MINKNRFFDSNPEIRRIATELYAKVKNLPIISLHGYGDSFGEEGNVFHYIICDAMPDGTIKQKIVKFYTK